MRKIPSRRTAFAWMMGLAVVLALLPVGITRNLKNVVSPLLTPVSGLSSRFRLSAVRQFNDQVGPRYSPEQTRKLIRQFNTLQQQNVQLHQQLLAQAGRIERLSGLRENLTNPQVVLAPASVVGMDTGWLRNSLLVDRGQKDRIGLDQWVITAGASHGAKADQWVVDGRCVVGRIAQVGPYTARVQLLSDPGMKIEGEIYFRTKINNIASLPCLLVGQGRNRMRADNLPRKHPLKPGMLVGLKQSRGVLPPGLIVGEVETVEPAPGKLLFQRVIVRLRAPADEIEEVFVVVPLAQRRNRR